MEAETRQSSSRREPGAGQRWCREDAARGAPPRRRLHLRPARRAERASKTSRALTILKARRRAFARSRAAPAAARRNGWSSIRRSSSAASPAPRRTGGRAPAGGRRAADTSVGPAPALSAPTGVSGAAEAVGYGFRTRRTHAQRSRDPPQALRLRPLGEPEDARVGRGADGRGVRAARSAAASARSRGRSCTSTAPTGSGSSASTGVRRGPCRRSERPGGPRALAREVARGRGRAATRTSRR